LSGFLIDTNVISEYSAQAFSRNVTTNANGDYLVPGLEAGIYDITITATGFQQYKVSQLTLRVGEKARADAALTVGSVTAEIEVAGTSVAEVQTESAELSGVLTTKQIDQTVVNGRNFTQLITLVPGVSNQTGQDEGTVGIYGSVAFSVNGGRTEYNNWELDGGDNMDNGSNGTLNTYPNVDAIAEVKVLTSNYGYTIGGPVFIPRLYNTDRQKTFFFFSEEWRKETVPGQTFDQQVPSDAERTGNFSDVCPGTSCPVNPATKLPYPNNQVPVSPQAQALLTLIPAANSGSGASSYYQAAPVQPTSFREELVRVDQNISDKERFFYRFVHDSWQTVTPTALWSSPGSSFPTVETNFVGPGVAMVANLASTVSPTLLNEFLFSYTADHIFLTAIGNAARPSSFDMPGIYNNGFADCFRTLRFKIPANTAAGFRPRQGISRGTTPIRPTPTKTRSPRSSDRIIST
jgi:hypothetical protein